MKKVLLCILCAMLCVMLLPLFAYAHSGGTDSNGGHYNHDTGGYHYHHGYSAHSHYDIDGDGRKDCPYEFKYTTDPEGSIEPAKKNDSIFTKILKVIGLSILTVLVGVSSGILILLYFLLMLPVEAVVKRCCRDGSQEDIVERCGAVVKVIMAIAIVVVLTIIIF